MKIDTKSKIWFVLGSWILSIVLILPSNFILAHYLDVALAVENTVLSTVIQFIVLGSVGFIVPIAQWGVLRKYFPRAILWLIVTLLGWIITWVINSIISPTIPYPIPQFVRIAFPILYAAVRGMAQWLYLRLYLKNAGWWIVVSILGSLVMLIAERFLYIFGFLIAVLLYPFSQNFGLF